MKREYMIRIRVNELEREMLFKKAKDNDTTLSEYLRSGITNNVK